MPTTERRPLIDGYDGVVCDLDGVVYRGGEAVPGAPASLHSLQERRIRVVYATNNASRVPAEVVRQLVQLGAPAAEDDVVTSAQAGAARLAADLPAAAKVLALGGPGVVEALIRAGLTPLGRAAPPDAADDATDDEMVDVSAVLQGFGRDLTVGDFETAARLLTRGVLWVATNDDATLPTTWGQAPGNGAYVDLLAAAVGRAPDVVVGKPHPPLYRLALDRLGTTAPRTLAVGDRLATDIEGARAAGLDSAWVLTGVNRPSDLVDTEVLPTYVIASLAQLLEPYAVPERDASGWRCGAGRVTRSRDGLVVEQSGADPIETVRAGLAALTEARGTATVDRLRRDADVLDRLAAQSGGPVAPQQPEPVPGEEPAANR